MLRNAAKYACKPDSVWLRRAAAIISLGHASPRASMQRSSCGRAVRGREGHYRAVLLQVGFTRARVTATLRELLPHDFTLAPCHPELVEGAVCFCGTFLRVAPTGRYPAPCPMKPGLSSPPAAIWRILSSSWASCARAHFGPRLLKLRQMATGGANARRTSLEQYSMGCYLGGGGVGAHCACGQQPHTPFRFAHATVLGGQHFS
jgi:hypothetical protein